MRTKLAYLGAAGLGFLLLVLPGVVVTSTQPSPPLNVSESGQACVLVDNQCFANRPAIAVPPTGAGIVFLAWPQVNPDTNSSDIFFRTAVLGPDGELTFDVNGDGTPEPATVVAETTGVSRHPSLAALDPNHLFLVWSDNSPGDYDIFLSTSTDGGATWSPPLNLSKLPNTFQFPKEGKQPVIQVVGVVGTEVFVAWADNSQDDRLNPDGQFDVFLIHSSDGGETFANPVNVSNASGSEAAEAPALTVDDTQQVNPKVFLVWQQGAPFGGRRNVFFAQSVGFSSLINVSKRPNVQADSTEPVIAIQRIPTAGESREVLVLWTENPGSGLSQIFSNSARDAGIPHSTPRFGTPFNLSKTDTPSRSADLAVDLRRPDPAIFIVWESDFGRFGGAPEIFFRSSFDPFGPPLNLSNTVTIQSKLPAIAQDGQNAYVAWVEVDQQAGTFEIFLSRVPIPGVQ